MSAVTLYFASRGAPRRKVDSLSFNCLWWTVPSYSCRHCKLFLNVCRQEYHQQGPATRPGWTQERSLWRRRTLDANTRRRWSASYCHFDRNFTTSSKRLSSRCPTKFVHQVRNSWFQVLRLKLKGCPVRTRHVTKIPQILVGVPVSVRYV